MIVIDCKTEEYAKESLKQWDYGQEVLLTGLEIQTETIEATAEKIARSKNVTV